MRFFYEINSENLLIKEIIKKIHIIQGIHHLKEPYPTKIDFRTLVNLPFTIQVVIKKKDTFVYKTVQQKAPCLF